MENISSLCRTGFNCNSEEQAQLGSNSTKNLNHDDISGWFHRIYGQSHHSLFQTEEVEFICSNCKVQESNLVSDTHISFRGNADFEIESYEIKEKDSKHNYEILPQKIYSNQKYPSGIVDPNKIANSSDSKFVDKSKEDSDFNDDESKDSLYKYNITSGNNVQKSNQKLSKEYFSDISHHKDYFSVKEFGIWSNQNFGCKVANRWGRKQAFEFINIELRKHCSSLDQFLQETQNANTTKQDQSILSELQIQILSQVAEMFGWQKTLLGLLQRLKIK